MKRYNSVIESMLGDVLGGEYINAQFDIAFLEDQRNAQLQLQALKDGIHKQNYAIMLESNGRYTIHDQSPEAKGLQKQTLKIINENIDLLMEVKKLKGNINEAVAYFESIKCRTCSVARNVRIILEEK